MVGGHVAIILGMGVGTYMLRVVPLLLGPRLTLSPRMIRWFQFLSFSIISSFVWFGYVKGPSSLEALSLRGIALGLTVLVAARVRSPIVGMAAGVGAVVILSQVGW